METLQEIYVLNKRLKLLHSEKGFKTSIDSVLLAAACPAMAGESVLDMGCGVGGAGFCVLSRIDRVLLTGVEIQAEHVKLAERNAIANLLQERSQFICSDIRDFKQEKNFNHVICNPPYLEAGAHLRSPHEEKATAMGHAEHDITIKDWVDAAHYNMKSNGALIMIHRADMIDKIMLAMGKRFGAIEIFPLWPRQKENAKRVIIRAIKDRKSPATIHAGMVLHNEDGSYTFEAEKILRDMESLF